MKQSDNSHAHIGHPAQAAAIALLLVATSAIAEAQTNLSQPLYARRIESFQGKTLEEKVQMLADREEIRDLIATYSHRAAQGLPIADLFTDDGAFITRLPGREPAEVHGRAALDRYFNILASGHEHPLPMIHNSLISIHGNEATGVSSIEVRAASDGLSMIGSGYYNDRYRRENGRWKFVVRDATFFHYVPLQQGWAKPSKPN